jgi:serine/threonine protein kinase/Tfp pilus assembly protein PilF
MALTPGTRLGTYEIVAPLGAGGMGEVYRAKDLRLRRDVALKVLPAGVASDPERLARFEREARTVAGLNHPNIVVLYSVDDEDGVRFLTMELVEGASIGQHIRPGGLPLKQVLELGMAMSDALSAAHGKGVVHRDLKPANVMLTPEGRVKILDFGLAKLAAAGATLSTTQAATVDAPLSTVGQMVGTVPYMAPEQVLGEAVDARTDLFALGVMLYELSTGLRPFNGASSIDVSAAILHGKPPSLRALRSDLPADLDRVIGRCLEKNPRERFQTALDVYNELRGVQRAIEHDERGTPDQPAGAGAASIAVLPFVNRSASADDEYFSDGLADELLNMLTKIRGLRVAARSSAFTFKERSTTASEVGKALNVATLLEGSVRRAGNRVRISVQLVKVSDGYHLWSESYDRTLDDIFAVQDDIAQAVVKELRRTLLGEAMDSNGGGELKSEVANAAKGRATNAEAHRLYLQGLHLIDRRTREDTARGIAHLKRAVELDPEYALAWAHLSRAYEREASTGWYPKAEGLARAREAVERALSLEPSLSEAHSQLAWIRMSHDWDWRGAEQSCARALELAPGNSQVLRAAGALNHYLGRFEAAVELDRRAVECDPLNSAAYHNLGFVLAVAGRFTEAETAYRKAIELAPQGVLSHSGLAVPLLALGRSEEALEEAEREPIEAFRLWARAVVHHTLGHAAESDQALREMTERHADGFAFFIAELHGARGEREQAFEWLERAYAQRDNGICLALASPRLRSLHGDPRWSAFMKKLGFEA